MTLPAICAATAMLYLYAIINRPVAPLPSLFGLNGQPVQCSVCGDVAAIYSHYCGVQPQPEPRHLWCHEAVVEQLLEYVSVLPVRFGTLLPDEAALTALLHERHDRFKVALARVARHIEVSVRVLWSAPVVASTPRSRPPENGRAYIARRIAEEQAREARRREAHARASAIHDALSRLAVAHVHRVLPHERMLLSAAYLIPRDSLESFRAAVDTLSAANPDLPMLCTGPWPAYHFVDGA